MKTLALSDGDITVDVSRRAQFAFGKDKLIQDLKLWLAEPLGTGPTTPNFGSVLENYVGTADMQLAAVRVEAEVRRVLGLYQVWQTQKLRTARETGKLGYWQRSQVLAGVSSVKASVQYDRLIVDIVIQTLGTNEADMTARFQVTA